MFGHFITSCIKGLNKQENKENFPANIKSIKMMTGRRWMRVFPEVNSLTVSERKVETIEDSKPVFGESSVSGNGLVDIELLAAVILMLRCSFLKNTSIILQENFKKGLTDFCTSRSHDNSLDVTTRAAYSNMRATGQVYLRLQSWS